eukprot:541828-Amphidinium_carterae.1
MYRNTSMPGFEELNLGSSCRGEWCDSKLSDTQGPPNAQPLTQTGPRTRSSGISRISGKQLSHNHMVGSTGCTFSALLPC